MDPLSLAASITGILSFTISAATTIDSFITEYRATDSELKAIAKEVDALQSVLESLRSTYQKTNPVEESSRLSKFKKVFTRDSSNHGQTDKALESALDGLDGSMKQLVDVVTKSKLRMAKGGMHKVYVQALWQRTATGIEKVLP
jgi:Fungal N-terminal domain of STAND proteins